MKEETKLKIRVPENCGLCTKKIQYYDGGYICNAPVSKEKEILDISSFKVSLETRPDWCPLNNIVNIIDNMPEEKKVLVDKMIDGFSAMFELITDRG